MEHMNNAVLSYPNKKDKNIIILCHLLFTLLIANKMSYPMIKLTLAALLVLTALSKDSPPARFLPDRLYENTTINKVNFINTGQMFLRLGQFLSRYLASVCRGYI